MPLGEGGLLRGLLGDPCGEWVEVFCLLFGRSGVECRSGEEQRTGDPPTMENDTVSEWVVADRSLKIRLKSCAEPRASMALIRVRTSTRTTYSGGGT